MKRLKIFLILSCISGIGYSQLSWYQQNSGTNVVLFDICFFDHIHGWVSGNAGTILHTDDGGANWYEQDAPPNNTYYGIDFPTQYHGYACGYGGKIISTTDGGNFWENQESNTSTYLFDVFFVDENTGWIVGGDNGVFPSYISYRIVLHTNDGGANWIKQLDKTEESPLRNVFFVDHLTGYAVSETGDILYTEDGGSNWNRQAIYSSNQFSSVFFADVNHGWVVGTYLGLPHRAVIMITNDGGESWTEHFLMEGFSPADIFFFDEFNGWMVGSGGPLTLFYTHDRGYTWFPEDPGVFEPLFSIDFADESTGWASGNLGTIISSAIPVGVDNMHKSVDLNIFPNPASEYLNISLTGESNAQVEIYLINTVGQVALSSSAVLNQGNSVIQLDISSFTNGIYLLIMDDQKERVSEKIVIRHN